MAKTLLVIKSSLVWMEKSKKFHRHTIGEALFHSLLETIRCTARGNALPRPVRETALTDALSHAETAKLLVRLCGEESLIPTQHAVALSKESVEICKMIQGWINSCRQAPGRQKEEQRHLF